MSAELDPPKGFAFGHWSDHQAQTGCTVVIPPPQTAMGVDVRGGGPGTRETDVAGPLANAGAAAAVLMTGGSAFGLAAADGVVRWCEEQGRGYETPAGVVPLVPAAVVYDLLAGRADVRPGPDEGYAACQAAVEGAPERGRVGAGSGTAAGKALGRERAVPTGVGYAAIMAGGGARVAAIAVVNASGDVIDADGSLLAAPRTDDGRPVRSADLIASATSEPDWSGAEARENTTLICICTDAGLGKLGATKVARMAGAGIARAVDPVFTPFDGDVTFCLASGQTEPTTLEILTIGTAAATVTAAAIRDGVRPPGR